MPEARIATLTMNPAVDKSSTADDIIPDQKTRCAAPRFEPGGGGINVARAIHKLGGRALAVFPAGGPTGRRLRDLLDDEGVEFDAVDSDADVRENLTVFENSSERQFRFGMPGATLSESEQEACLKRIRAAKPQWIVASGSLPPGVKDDYYVRVADLAEECGAKCIIDTSGDPLRRATDHGVFLLKPNAREFAQLVGAEFESEEQQEKQARDLIERGAAEHLVLSLGAAGVLYVTRERTERIRSPSVPIRSKVGAGDSTTAGLVLAFARGWSARDAICFGVAAGAAAVMTPGSELCRKEDAENLCSRLCENC